MDAGVGLAIQCVGIALVTLLSFFIRRSIQCASLKYWMIAWSCLSIGLCSLLVSFHYSSLQVVCYPLYFFGEYAFGYMFIAGCRNHATGARLNRRHLSLLVPAIALAVGLPRLSSDFNDLFMIHALFFSCLFAAAFYALRPARRRREQTSPGLRVMSVALLMLAIDFLHYVPVFGARSGAWGFSVPPGYLKYTSIFDLILEILLGFGTVMVLMEGVRHEIEATNRELTDARDKLEVIARVDPLTEALNRHAFHSLLSGSDSSGEHVHGCVAVIDIDNLKPINDSCGHAAGDAAIRAVAHATRQLIRADDMLFRWGGDEFLILMLGIPETVARKRLDSLNPALARTKLRGVSEPFRVSVSCGFACFRSMTQLQHAIEQADRGMYQRKQLRKAAEKI